MASQHRPSYWMRYALSRGSAASILLTLVLYSTRTVNSPQSHHSIANERGKSRCPECLRLFNDIIDSMKDIRNWWFDLSPNDDGSYYGLFKSPFYLYGHSVNGPEFFELLARSSFYVLVMMAFFIPLKMASREKLTAFFIAIAPTFLTAMFGITHEMSTDKGGMGDTGDNTMYAHYGTDAARIPQQVGPRHNPPDEGPYNDPDETCATHAYRVEEMARTIEYLAKVNNQREQDITKLSLKNDFLAESLARAYKYNRKLQDQLRHLPPEDSQSVSADAH